MHSTPRFPAHPPDHDRLPVPGGCPGLDTSLCFCRQRCMEHSSTLQCFVKRSLMKCIVSFNCGCSCAVDREALAGVSTSSTCSWIGVKPPAPDATFQAAAALLLAAAERAAGPEAVAELMQVDGGAPGPAPAQPAAAVWKLGRSRANPGKRRRACRGQPTCWRPRQAAAWAGRGRSAGRVVWDSQRACLPPPCRPAAFSQRLN